MYTYMYIYIYISIYIYIYIYILTYGIGPVGVVLVPPGGPVGVRRVRVPAVTQPPRLCYARL